MLGGRTRYGLPVVLYHCAIGIAGLLLLFYCTAAQPLPHRPIAWLIFSLFLGMHLITSFLHFQYARLNVVITFEASFTTATLLVFGSLPAVWISVIGILTGSIKRVIARRFAMPNRIPVYYDVSIIVLNAGMVSLMWLSASWVYFRVLDGQFPLRSFSLEIIIAILLMYVSMSAVNHIVLFASSYFQGQDSIEFFRRAMIPAFFTEFAAVPFGVVMAFAYTTMGLLAFLFLAATLLLFNAFLRRLSLIRYDLEDKLKQLTILHQVSSQIISVREEDALARLLVDELEQIGEGGIWSIARLQEENLCFVSDGTSTPSSVHRLAQHAVETRKPILIANTEKECPDGLQTELLRDQIHSCIAIPMLAGNKIYGVLLGVSEKRATFTAEHTRLLTMVANHAALTLENAKLYSTLTDKVSELQQLNQQLRQFDRLKSEFLSNVSHELRTPLTSIKGYVEYIRKEKLGPITASQQEGLGVAHRNILRLQRLINDLLDYTRLEFKKTPLNLTTCSLSRIWNEVYEQFEESIKKKRLSLHVNIPCDLPLLYVDQEKLQQVISNLLGNAIKFTPDHGAIWFDTQPIRHHTRYYHFEVYTGNCPVESLVPVQISIRDTGIGIPDEAIPRIFDRFYQVDSSNTRKYGGTGLGLAFVKSILDAHGSPITVTSSLGEGTTFTVILPGIEPSDVPNAVKPLMQDEDAHPKYLT